MARGVGMQREDRGVGEGQDWIDPPEGWCRYGPRNVLPPRKSRKSDMDRSFYLVTLRHRSYRITSFP